jgi:lipopolysaccharide assembly outer membrane protein LptD (OstA)
LSFCLPLFAETYNNITPTVDAGTLKNQNSAITPTANTAPAKTITVDAAGDTTLPVIISGDTIIFDNRTNEIFGRGHVTVRHAENVIFADFIYINPDNGDVSGEGNVLAVFNNSRVYTDKIYYNTKTQDAYCKNADVISPPWIIRCERMVRQADKTQLLKPVFTTCDDVKPHYRMEAGEINLYGTKKIEAWNIAVYIGMIPVFYFPYFSQSLEQNKDPFQIKPGWTDPTGWSLSLAYSFFLRFFEQMTLDGSVGFNYYEKVGPSVNANLLYALFPGSTGTIAGSFLQDKNTRERRWWLNFVHSQAITDKMRAGLTAKSSSDSRLESDFLGQGQVDMFRHEFSGSFTGTFFNTHTIGLDVNDTEQLDNTKNAYYTYTRLLPSLSYSMPSTQLFPFFYYNHSINLSRSYQCVTCTSASKVEYSDVGSFAPGIQINTPKIGFATLSTSAGFKSSWTKRETKTDEGWGELLNFVNTSETLQLDIIPGGHMQGQLSHSYAKQMNKITGLLHDGISSNLLTGSLSGGLDTFSFTAGMTYDMLANRSELFRPEDLYRFSLLNLNGSFRQDVYDMTASSAVSVYTGQVKSTNLNLSLIDNSPKKLWSVSAIAGFINNRLDAAGHSLTPTVIPQDDSLTFSTLFAFAFTPDFQVSVYRGYDLTQKILLSQSYALTWFVHCWQADFSYTKRQDGKEEYFFTVSIAAIPEFRVSKPSSAMPDQFNNLQSLIQP